MNTKLFFLLAASGLLAFALPSTQPTVEESATIAEIMITDQDLLAGESYTWTNDNIYLLDGQVVLENGGMLTIEAGTVVKGVANPTTGDFTSSLVIAAGASIFANGTENNPIIFTAEADNTDDPTDLGADEVRGLWGGLHILGFAPISFEGLNDYFPGITSEDDRFFYGGNAVIDSSGILNYVSIRHGGRNQLEGSDAGLTLAGVGAGTIIDHVEVFASSGDGFGILGGDVNLRYVSASFCSRSSFFYDDGWRGQGQFWFSINDDDGPAGFAGLFLGLSGVSETYFSQPEIYNATFIGSGLDAEPGGEGLTHAFFCQDFAGGAVNNSIITEFPSRAIYTENTELTNADAYGNFLNGDLGFNDNIWHEIGDNSNFAPLMDGGDPNDMASRIADDGNEFTDPLLVSVEWAPAAKLDPRLGIDSPAFNFGPIPTSNFLEAVGYKGAFDGENLWLNGWTALDEYNYLVNEVVEDPPAPTDCANTIYVEDDDLLGGESYTWTNENCYVLTENVYLEVEGSLEIQAGTRIFGQSGSALIIASGAKILAEGTPEQSIIFTSVTDSLSTTTDAIDVNLEQRLWGGLVILGAAPINAGEDTQDYYAPVDDGEHDFYGGANAEDYSGILRHVSIRHAGEYNAGLALAGVGSATVIDHVEVIASSTGYDIRGGTVNMKYLVAAFHREYPFAITQGWSGKGQFWFGLQSSDGMFRLDDLVDTINRPVPTISHGTFIGSGPEALETDESTNGMVEYRSGATGVFQDCIFTEGNEFGIRFNNSASSISSMRALEDRAIALRRNIWFDITNGVNLQLGQNDVVRAIGDFSNRAVDERTFLDSMYVKANMTNDPELVGISRLPDGGLDPRPRGSAAYANIQYSSAGESVLDSVNFRGAFGLEENLWPLNWTFLDQAGYFGSIPPVEVDLSGVPESIDTTAGSEDLRLIVSFSDTVSQTNYLLEQSRLDSMGLIAIDSCDFRGDGISLLQLWKAENAFDLHASATGGSSRVRADTTEIDLALIYPLEGVEKKDGPIFCLIPQTDQDKSYRADVAILDSGVDLYDEVFRPNGNELLAGHLYSLPPATVGSNQFDPKPTPILNGGYDFVNNTTEVVDVVGHGTHIAGIVRNQLPSDIDLRMMDLKVFHADRGNLFDLICALHEAIDHEVDVINLSLGYIAENPSPALYWALEEAQEAGIPVIISAGNEGVNLDQDGGEPRLYRWPGQFRTFKDTTIFEPLKNLLVVTALDGELQTVDTSAYNYGPLNVDVAARGTNIVSTAKMTENEAFHPTPLDTLSGSSMAVGFVVNTIAVARAYNPNLSYGDILGCIKESVIQLPGHDSIPLVAEGKHDHLRTLKCLGIPVEELGLQDNASGPDHCPCYPGYSDLDQDGICDPIDLCWGADDSTDLNNDGIPDDCRRCPGSSGPLPYFPGTDLRGVLLNVNGSCAQYNVAQAANDNLDVSVPCFPALDSSTQWYNLRYYFNAPTDGTVSVFIDRDVVKVNQLFITVVDPISRSVLTCVDGPPAGQDSPVFLSLSGLTANRDYFLRITTTVSDPNAAYLYLRLED